MRFFCAVLGLVLFLGWFPNVQAQESALGTEATPVESVPVAPPGSSNEDDARSKPYLNYGNPSFDEDEEEDTLYFQYGRFFGVGLGVGYQAFTGNRGMLYQPSFPRLDVRAQVWFDFNFALVMGLSYAGHNFTYLLQPFTAKFLGYGLDLKYYFDVRDASSAWSFANPFLIGGLEGLNKTVSTPTDLAPEVESAFGFSVGGGLEFPMAHRKAYITLDLRYHFVSFEDQYSTRFNGKVPDLGGNLYSFSIQALFTW